MTTPNLNFTIQQLNADFTLEPAADVTLTVEDSVTVNFTTSGNTGGVSWTSVANIAVGDQFMAASSTFITPGSNYVTNDIVNTNEDYWWNVNANLPANISSSLFAVGGNTIAFAGIQPITSYPLTQPIGLPFNPKIVYSNSINGPWSEYTFSNPQTIIGNMLYLNNTFIIIGFDFSGNVATPFLRSSTDLITWNNNTYPATDAAVLDYVDGNNFIFDGTRYVCVFPSGSNARVSYSTDLNTWTQSSLPVFGGTPYNIAYGNGTYVVMFANNTIASNVYTSTDLTTWTQRQNYIATGGFTVNNILRLIFANGTFITNNGYKTTDFNTWTIIPNVNVNNYSRDLVDLQYIDSKFYLVGTPSTAVQGSGVTGLFVPNQVGKIFIGDSTANSWSNPSTSIDLNCRISRVFKFNNRVYCIGTLGQLNSNQPDIDNVNKTTILLSPLEKDLLYVNGNIPAPSGTYKCLGSVNYTQPVSYWVRIV